ncbi:DUF7002 family protein [Wenxinia saemankumensis]|uniref:Uncharacterized protein n=1 Tax=Wenxinia saemankumensis TaxID=1447782 RepID=A0A1M6C4M5_9RHOB|nr:hypothetical protein [Wenxinia saemankumensis]SHI55893.1 hypothetical protein SAMN05444417_1002 [Wenxinia saemankumensis]
MARLDLPRFCAMFPRLYRLSSLGSAQGIRRHGLLCAADIAASAGGILPAGPRPVAIVYRLPDGTAITVTDNTPLSVARLAACLDDGLSPSDWLAMLNARLLFWPTERTGEGNRRARARLDYASEWHVFDTAALLEGAWDRTEIAPINTGSTIHRPARRGAATFARVAGLDYAAWRRARGRASPDIVKEVTILGSLGRAGEALIDVRPA